MTFQNMSTGAKGEDLAVDLLRTKGYRILERNYRFGKAEIDIVARIGNDIAFVEVKTRRNISDLLPEDLVTPRQSQLIFRAADHYMECSGIDAESRFDLILVDPFRYPHFVEHIEGAFYPFDTF